MAPLKLQIPWWAKLSIKLMLARLPLGYSAWRRLPIFKHGFMASPEYAYRIFEKHISGLDLPSGFVSLELGPGDSLFSALISYGLGGRSSYLVDTGAYAIEDIDAYQAMADFLLTQGIPLPNIDNSNCLEQTLNTVSAKYLTDGINSLRTIPSASVDFVWSNAVLEHVRRHDFRAVMQELRRILKPNGICSHEIDLRDHLGSGLNNLRFSSSFWEQNWMATSGFYTNRIRYSEMIKIFNKTGFVLKENIILSRWDVLPISRNRLSSEFRNFSDEDLKIATFSVVLEPSDG
ncbi:MAG: methyltransferase domain-containing protein [Leptolyngbyaceae cyanobacterium]